MAKSRGKAVSAQVGMSAPGRANSGVSSPATGTKVGRKVSGTMPKGKSQTMRNGTRTGIGKVMPGGI